MRTVELCVLLRLPAMGSDVERVVALSPLNLHPLLAIEGQVEGVVALRSVESRVRPWSSRRTTDWRCPRWLSVPLEPLVTVAVLVAPSMRDDDSRLVQWRARLPPRAAVVECLPVDRAVGVDDSVVADGPVYVVAVATVVPRIEDIVAVVAAVQAVAAVGAEQRVVAVAAHQLPHIPDDGVDTAEAVVAHAARGEIGMDAPVEDR